LIDFYFLVLTTRVNHSQLNQPENPALEPDIVAVPVEVAVGTTVEEDIVEDQGII
jgi:hypothetical protein